MGAVIRHRRVVEPIPPSPEEKVLRLEPHDDPESVRHALEGVTRIEIHFPRFGEGRGYSTGWLLRSRYGYRGELRAVGHLTRDHLPYLERLGFDSAELREGEDPHAALAAFDALTVAYQKNGV